MIKLTQHLVGDVPTRYILVNPACITTVHANAGPSGGSLVGMNEGSESVFVHVTETLDQIQELCLNYQFGNILIAGVEEGTNEN